MLGLDPPRQGVAQRRRDCPGLLVTGATVSRDHHRAQVAEIELLQYGDRRAGTVLPLSGLELGEEPLGERHELVALDLGQALLAVAGVLLGDGLTNRRHAALEHLLGEDLLFGRQLAQDGGSMRPSRTEPLWTGLFRSLRARGSARTVTPSAVAAGAVATRAVAPTISTASSTVGGTVTPGTVAPVATVPALIAVPTTALGGKRRGDQLCGTLALDQLDAFVAILTLRLRSNDGDDLDPVQRLLRLGPNDITDLRPGGQDGSVQLALGQLGAGLAPGPRTIWACWSTRCPNGST